MANSILQWLSLVGIIWLQSINGTNTDFPAYSSQLKSLLSISQVQLNNLAFASDAGKLFGWLSGVAMVYLPLWAVLIIGATLGLIGYGLQFLFLVHKITSLAYWQIFMLTVLAGNSICWINTVCYVVAIKNFPFDRQIAVGLSTSYVGLSAKVYTDIVDAVSAPSQYPKKAKIYLLLNSIMPLVVSVVTAPFLGNSETIRTKGLDFGFIFMFCITIVTGIYAVVTSLGLTKALSASLNAICLGVFLSIPLVIPLVVNVREVIRGKCLNKRGKRVCDYIIDGEVSVEERTENGVNGEDASVEERMENGVKQEEVVEEEKCKIRVIEECGVRTMLKRVEFWLYFFVYMFGATLGLVYLNNLGQIAESRGHSKTSSLVSLSSSFGFFGRLMPSLLDYFFSRSKHMVSRTACITALMLPMTGAFFLLLSTSKISMYTSTAIIGVCTGAISSIAVSTTTELFGTKKFSINHNVVVANIPIGSFLFGYLAAVLYQREGDHDGRCMGAECYRNTFIIWGCICSLGTFLSFILYARTRKFYSQSL